VVLLVLAAVAAASMWFYVDRILVGYQVADAALHERPRGNLSDLYPRWLGARELLLHRRNPYGDDIALEIQKGYYGRALDPARPNDPKDKQGFAYPVYVVFLLAPLIGLPFHGVQIFFHWLLVALTAASVWLWLRGLRWRLPGAVIAAGMVLTLGCFPAVQGLKLQQLTLLVGALLAGAVACVSGGFLFCGGVLLALATIKPQLAWPLVAWLLMWAVSDWRARRRFLFGFGLVMGLLLAGAEIILPGWWRMFVAAVAEYYQYTQSQSVLEDILKVASGSVVVGRVGGQVLAAMAVLACGAILWKLRREQVGTTAFSGAAVLVVALTVLVARDSVYNQVLLLPAILLLARGRARFLSHSRNRRMVYLVGALLVGWQWVASLGLCAAYLMGARDWALTHWTWPFFATFALPVWMFALIFLCVQDERSRVVEGPFP